MFLYNILFYTCALIKTKIIRTPIFETIPLIKLHDVVLFYDITQSNKLIENNYEYKNIYIIDYTPIENISQLSVILKMLSGENIKGEVNIFYFDKINKKNIIDQSYKKFPSKFKKFNKNIYKIVNSWNSSFNLYNHNCKHFSNYFTKEINKIT